GAGPAGIVAALAAGSTGARVILADEQAELGGSLLSTGEPVDDKPAPEWLAEAVAALGRMPEGRLPPRTPALASYHHTSLTRRERTGAPLAAPAPHLPRQRLWRVRAKQVVLATGAIERPLVFADNDRPGIMMAGAAQAYVRRYGVLPGR